MSAMRFHPESRPRSPEVVHITGVRSKNVHGVEPMHKTGSDPEITKLNT